MCHEYHAGAWDRSTVDGEDDEEEETPSFMNDDPAEDVELLTDGGDE